MEQTGNALDASRGLPDTFDVDRTLDEFVEYFHREFMINIPRNVMADKRLMTKHIREFYRSRGSQESYRFLFRVLFDEEIDFYYPGDDILRASDGRYVKETVIRARPVAGNPLNLDGKQITGATSGASARVQSIQQILASGLVLFQFQVERVIGTFVEDELVSDGLGNSVRIFNAAGSIQDALIINGGAFHVAGDSVTLAGENGGSASGVISSTTDMSAVTFRILNGGSGYRVANTSLSVTGGDPTIPAQLSIINLSNTEIISLNSNVINPVKDVVLNSLPFGAGTPTFAASNANSVLSDALTFSNTTVGSINTIGLLVPGVGYIGQLPTVTALDADVTSQFIADTERGGIKGQNAVIIASRAYGAISGVSIETSDVNFLKNDNITITNTSRSAANTTIITADQFGGIDRGLIRKGLYPATVTAEIEGTFELPGRYTDTKGFLSWNNKLQDNDYYQVFSYALIVRKILDDYQNVVKSVVHPAGTKLFGHVRNDNSLDLATDFDVESEVSTSVI